MKTTEAGVFAGGGSQAWRRMNAEVFASKGRPRRARRTKRRSSKSPGEWWVGRGYLDRIARAVEREREHQRVPRLPMECDGVLAHVFQCVCCGRVRGDQERREPNSEVCIRCVVDAGFWN
jgi:hypothetical protein